MKARPAFASRSRGGTASCGFGYKTAWFALRGADVDAVATALRLSTVRPMPAAQAIAAAYESNGAFITPPLKGWTLVMSVDFLYLADGPSPDFVSTLTRLSAELHCEAQFFASHRVVECHAWASAVDGEMRRAYCYEGSSGEKRVDIGEPTPQEEALQHRFFDPCSPDAGTDEYWERGEQQGLRFADEKDVMDVAGLWSVDPSIDGAIPDGFLADFDARPVKTRAIPQPSRPAKPWWRIW